MDFHEISKVVSAGKENGVPLKPWSVDFASGQLNSGGHLGLIVMHIIQAYARSTTTDIDRFTRYS